MNSELEEQGSRGRLVHRSPAYPAIGLEEAIAKVRVVWEKERANKAPLDVIASHLGYKTAVGPGGVTISALLKFGLLEDEGSGAARQAKVTERARRIVLGSDDRPALLQEAALLPAIHKELWEKWGPELPSPESMKRYLLVERNFNERVAPDFVTQYIDTLDYAGLRDTIEEATVDKGAGRSPAGRSDMEEGSRPPKGDTGGRPRERTGMTVLSFQISERLVEVAVPGGPLTKGEIETLQAYLTIQGKIAPETSNLPARQEAAGEEPQDD